MIGWIIGLLGSLATFYVNAKTAVDPPKGKQSLPRLLDIFIFGHGLEYGDD